MLTIQKKSINIFYLERNVHFFKSNIKNSVEIDFIQFPIPSLVTRSVVGRVVVTVVAVVVVLNRGVVVQSIVVFVSSTVVALPYSVVALMSTFVVALAIVAVVAFADTVVALAFRGVVTTLKPLPSPPLLPSIGIKLSAGYVQYV
jgi:hypothetical protein